MRYWMNFFIETDEFFHYFTDMTILIRKMDCIYGPADLVFAPTPALTRISPEDLLLNCAMITAALRISLRGTFRPQLAWPFNHRPEPCICTAVLILVKLFYVTLHTDVDTPGRSASRCRMPVCHDL